MNKQLSLKKAFTDLLLYKKFGFEICKYCSLESSKKVLGSSRLDDVVKGQYAIYANSILVVGGDYL